eukprot:scaffold4425_cov281-Chaetoceros_neogracile.AAC.6
MIEAPQVQYVLSSNHISEKGASRLISKFLVEQKKYNENNEIDNAPANNTSEEEYFDMEDDDNCGTFEEVESRLAGIVRSLSGVKKTVEPTVAPAITPAKHGITEEDQSVAPTEEQVETDVIPIKTEEAAIEETTPITDMKSKKKLEKEAKKSTKKAKKKAEKEAKKSAKKKRKASGGNSVSAKRVKTEV